MVALTRFWILLSTLLVSAGWILSAFHALNRTGYVIIFALAGIVWVIFRAKSPEPGKRNQTRTFYKLSRRFRHLLPLAFLMVALLSLLAGILYASSNGDTNSYRIPRVFEWLGGERWYWLHTQDTRMNIAGAGFEWLCAPIALFTGYDRGFYLINIISYLLLPGLIYSVFIRLGVPRTVAWWWMWLLPSGWCYVWQAQAVVNDSFGVIYALASVDFALRARRSQRMEDWWLAVLAAALLSGTKQTCIPLVLVSVVAIWPGLRAMLARPFPTLLVGLMAVLVSAIPMALLDLRHTGNWMGTTPDSNGWSSTTLNSPFWGIIGNTFCLAVQNLIPPLFPWDSAWNSAMKQFLQTPFGSHFNGFENFCHVVQATTEASSGIGMFLSLFTFLSVGWACRHKAARSAVRPLPVDWSVRLIWLAPWVSLLAFMAKVGSFENARQMAAYYVFFFPILLVAPGHIKIVRQIWWQRLAGIIGLAAVFIVITSRITPLFPAETLFGWLHARYPHSTGIAHALTSFTSSESVKLERTAFHSELPPEEKIIGYYCGNGCGSEPGYWQPFGIRKVQRVLPTDSPDWVRSLGIHYIVVDGQALFVYRVENGRPLAPTTETIAEWAREYNAEILGDVTVPLVWGKPPEHLYLAHLLAMPAH